jgi:hypothetical protein
MRRLKFRYNKKEREHEYKEKLVVSAKNTFEELRSGADDLTQAPAFNHDNQDPSLDSVHISRTPLRYLKPQSPIGPGTGWNRLTYNSQFAK